MRTRKLGMRAQTTDAFMAEDVFTNAEAQDFAFEVQTRGVEALNEALNQKPIPNRIWRILAACEVVAAANGHPPRPSGWCAMLESWLFESKYLPPTTILKRAEEQVSAALTSPLKDAVHPVPSESVNGLLGRLQNPSRKVTWKAIKGDRPAFRALATLLNTSQGEVDGGPIFDRSGNARVILTFLTVNAACKLINYPKVRQLELWLNNQNDRKELAASLKILLRGWRTSIEQFEADHVVDLTIRTTPSPYRTLVDCKALLADLPVLHTFTTKNMYFDDGALECVCQNRAIQEISIIASCAANESFL